MRSLAFLTLSLLGLIPVTVFLFFAHPPASFLLWIVAAFCWIPFVARSLSDLVPE